MLSCNSALILPAGTESHHSLCRYGAVLSCCVGFMECRLTLSCHLSADKGTSCARGSRSGADPSDRVRGGRRAAPGGDWCRGGSGPSPSIAPGLILILPRAVNRSASRLAHFFPLLYPTALKWSSHTESLILTETKLKERVCTGEH